MSEVLNSRGAILSGLEQSTLQLIILDYKNHIKIMGLEVLGRRW
jgi:hypothetical protein